MSDSISSAPTGDPQTPDPTALFYDITAGTPNLTAWDVMFAAAEELLQTTVLDGITPEDIGRMAWDLLPDPEQAEALDQLFYTYWSARQNDREELARYERQRADDEYREALGMQLVDPTPEDGSL